MQRERKKKTEIDNQKNKGFPTRCKLFVAEWSLEILENWKTASLVKWRQKKKDNDETREVDEDSNAGPSGLYWTNFILANQKI